MCPTVCVSACVCLFDWELIRPLTKWPLLYECVCVMEIPACAHMGVVFFKSERTVICNCGHFFNMRNPNGGNFINVKS